DFLWPMAVTTSPDVMPLAVVTAVLSRIFSGPQNSGIVTFVMAFFGMLVWFAVPFVLLQVFVFDRLALLGGKTDYSVYEKPAAAQPEIQLEE
ncbi:MAG: hypothetical protein K8I60_16255, partial [Anaerolineae bacterium]|nr:hypothetical protein [Anaerolineae bacterium]